jgi:acetyltransferase-like isoleucine patch superfamily enzyme
VIVEPPPLHLLTPGKALEGDLYPGPLPQNIIAGENTRIDSGACFHDFRAKGPVGLRTGVNVTLWRTSLAPEENAIIEIGDDSWIANAILVCSVGITIGKRVFIAGGVTIADSDFHPLTPSARLLDTVAVSPGGDRLRRPPIEARPIEIEDDVWIGYNAAILKGVRIAAGAVIAPGAVVTANVPAGCTVAGNPARIVDRKRVPLCAFAGEA